MSKTVRLKLTHISRSFSRVRQSGRVPTILLSLRYLSHFIALREGNTGSFGSYMRFNSAMLFHRGSCPSIKFEDKNLVTIRKGVSLQWTNISLNRVRVGHSGRVPVILFPYKRLSASFLLVSLGLKQTHIWSNFVIFLHPGRVPLIRLVSSCLINQWEISKWQINSRERHAGHLHGLDIDKSFPFWERSRDLIIR